MKMTSVILRLWLSCSLFTIALAAEENIECLTTESLRGTCVHVTQCPRLFELYLKPRPLPDSTIQLLRGEDCGSVNRQHLVCCRDEAIPTTVITRVQPETGFDLINPDLTSQTSAEQITDDHPDSKSCRRLSVPSVDISCEYGGYPVPCNRKAFVGTRAISTCMEGLLPVNDDEETHRAMTCLPGGKWSRLPQTCAEMCGVPSFNTQYLIGGGMKGVVPWHVSIYKKINETYWEHKCGGTLIDTKYVLSAANCFWDNKKQRPTNESLYMIAVGKDLIDFNAKEFHVQRKQVSKIYIPNRYRGRATHFSHDIALLRLKHRVKLEAGIRLACVDWKREKEEEQLTAGNKGTVAGWGVTESDLPSKRLLTVRLPFINYTKCVDGLSEDLKSLLTYDKFCAGYENKDISVCKGDSGGGLVFQDVRSGRFYIQGIVSNSNQPFDYTNSKCFAQKYTAFTQVSLYYDWLKDAILGIEE